MSDEIVGFFPGCLFKDAITFDQRTAQTLRMIIKAKGIPSLKAGMAMIDLGIIRCLNR